MTATARLLSSIVGGAALALVLAAPAVAQVTSPTPAPPESPSEAVSSGELATEPLLPSTEAAPTATPPPQPATPPAPTISFTLPFPEDQGGGEATGSAGSLEYQREDYATLTGSVHIRYQDIDVRADEVSIDLTTKELTALGNVIIDQGPDRLTAATATYDLDTKTGVLRDATGAAGSGIYFSGAEVAKISADEYVIKDGTFTACEGEVPPWSFHVSKAKLQEEGYARITNASMRVKVVPVLYFPYIIWPTKTERASGFLIPKVGSSDKRGTYLGMAYYQTLGRSWDTTLYADLYSEDYLGVGSELRYHPTEGTSGTLRGWAVDDPEFEDYRWKLRWDHESKDLPAGMRGVVHYEEYSDFDFLLDFERSLDNNAKSSVYSNAFVTGNWGNQSLNVLVDRRQTFIVEDNVITLQKLPEVQYRLRPTRIGKLPLYASVNGAGHYLSMQRGTLDGKYGRLDIDPQLRLPLNPAPWLSVTLTAGERLTWYGDTVSVVNNQQVFSGEALTRLLPTAGVEVIGPSFSRIFDAAVGPFGKLKHIVEPRLVYNYNQAYDDQERVPLFDELDPIGNRNLSRITLANRILGKPSDPAKGGGAREIFNFEISRRYSFDEEVPLERSPGEETQWGPWELTLRSYPTERFGLRLDADYSDLFGQLTGVSASGNFAVGRQRFDFTWTPRWQAQNGEVVANQASFGMRLNPFQSGKLTLASSVSYDFERDLLRDQRHFININGSCWGMRLELHELETINQKRREWLFSVDLKNVGTFLDLTGGETNDF